MPEKFDHKNVIHKEGNNWRVEGHKNKGANNSKGMWPQKFKTKTAASNALKAYHAKKG